MLREAVRAFSVSEIAPHVQAMDEEQKIDGALIRKLFELGVMGIEIPESDGGDLVRASSRRC